MNQRAVSLLLAAALPLSGCTAMLDRGYQSIAPHAEHSPTEGDASVLQAETYQGLVNAILYCVTQGKEHGVIRLTANYARDVEEDLAAACLEVVQEDPLGAYVVDFITHSWRRIVSYYEVELDVTYRRTREQAAKIITATGASAIRAELRRALSGFSPELVLRISAFSGDEAYIESLLREAYYSTPAAALGFPEFTLTLYPDQGPQRIVEVVLTYPVRDALLHEQSAELTAATADLAGVIRETTSESAYTAAVHALLHETALYTPEGGRTAYDLFFAGEAGSEGFALAAALLCNALGMQTNVVAGRLNGVPHYWNVIQTDDIPYCIDFIQNELRLFTEAEMVDLGYEKDGNS